MKNVVKTFAVTVVLVAIGVSAQAQVKFGVKAGVNVNNIGQSYEESDSEFETKARIGFHVGATADLALSDVLGVQSGLLFTRKGYAIDVEETYSDAAEGHSWTTWNYLEVPVNVTYKISDFQVYAGPYVAFGIGGKGEIDIEAEDGSLSGEYDLKPVFGEVGEGDVEEDEVPYNAFDFGFNVGVGYQFGPVLVNAGYSLGLTNVLPTLEGDDSDDKQSNRVASLSVTYFFGE